MTILLTAACVTLALGLLLLLMGLAGRRAPEPGGFGVVSDDPNAPQPSGAEPPATTRRKVRPVPLLLGLVLAIAGGVGVGLILREGLASDRLDEWVLQRWPAGMLVSDLSLEDSRRRNAAHRELTRRYEADELDEELEHELTNRYIAYLGEDLRFRGSVPAVVEVDLGRSRRDGHIEDAEWGRLVAERSPLRAQLPRRAAMTEPMEVGVGAGLDDPLAPAWILIRFTGMRFGEQELEVPQSIIVAANPNWRMATPEEADEWMMSRGFDIPVRRMVGVEQEVPAEVLQALGAGTHDFVLSAHVYAFDPEETPAPAELLASQSADQQQSPEPGPMNPAVVSARITPEQAEQLIPKAIGNAERPIERRIQLLTAEEQAEMERQREEARQRRAAAGGEGAGGRPMGNAAGAVAPRRPTGDGATTDPTTNPTTGPSTRPAGE